MHNYLLIYGFVCFAVFVLFRVFECFFFVFIIYFKKEEFEKSAPSLNRTYSMSYVSLIPNCIVTLAVTL